MDHHREQHIQALREQIARGDYAVDPRAVADAILWRIQGIDTAPELEPTPLTGRPGPRRIRRRERIAHRDVGSRPGAVAA